MDIGAYSGVKAVSCGDQAALSLGGSYARLESGLDYDSDCETVAPEVRTQQGSSQGALKATPTLWVYLVRTNTLTVNGVPVVTRSPTDYMDSGPPYVTGLKQIKKLGHSTTGTIRIQQTEPLPAKVIGIFATFDVSDN